ncbi:AraC family transcriptional regulator [Streptococcus macacae]|uniref:Transcriptional regulator, AraC family n=1 Tax=Streptococcus macacae NCTC 11558 TaxID=764298 RepID=G5JUP6_9STRE|nr:AraC family transcriptional regulator [Streptococcus macacae]EHJ53073.1 transcriptional regulator, AraC family [Streptococcus macacae NCTC 11558]SUN78861.1 AraC family transcriptional regulator [Streptococcus macacae NCTC 11558]
MTKQDELKNLETLLFEHTENENYYLTHSGSYSKRYEATYTERQFIDGKEVLMIDVGDLVHNPLHIRKDSRYTFMPFHTYRNINLNYIYSGKATYFIDNQEITLTAGDICFFDTQVVRAKMKPVHDDIIINIVMQHDYFKSLLTLDDKNLLTHFMSQTLYSNQSHNNYIIFRTGDSPQIRSLFEDLLLEQYKDRTYKMEASKHYFSLIFLELIYLSKQEDKSLIHFSDSSSNTIFNVVNYIEQHYQTTNLSELSQVFGYHEKYLSSLLKKSYGKSFKQIQIEKRLADVERYLNTSTLPISDIAERTGFTNLNQLYREFKNKHGLLPKAYRNQITGPGAGE